MTKPEPPPPFRASGGELIVSCRHCRGESPADLLDVLVAPECGCLCHQLGPAIDDRNRR